MGKKIIRAKRCGTCQIEYQIEVDSEQLERYDKGIEHVQNIFPEMSAENREFFFISGICGKCWDEMFSDEE